MSLLHLIRHGKASPLSNDYDQLSEAGFEQARLLGEHWADLGMVPDAIFVGPRRRHKETLDTARAAFEARGKKWPAAILMEELDEHDGLSLVIKSLPRLAEHDAEVRAAIAKMGSGDAPPLQGMLGIFKKVTRQWVRGELGHDEVEPWSHFRRRISAAMEKIAQIGRGKTVAAFTSAGAVAAAVGDALDISDEKVIELSWALFNGSVSELAFSDATWGLRAFNATPHLRDPKLLTSV